MKAALSKLTALIDGLVAEGNTILGSVKVETRKTPAVSNMYGDVEQWRYWNVEVFDVQACVRWSSRCAHLAVLLERHAGPWGAVLNAEITGSDDMRRLIGVLEAIKLQIDAGLLLSLQNLIAADMFDDLLEQAAYLREAGYFLAAGVLGRAVLEEHLRNWCAREACSPTKPRPTINDYNMALYDAKHIDKITMKQVDALAAIGNEAAHNEPALTPDTVERLLRDVRALLVKIRVTIAPNIA